MVCSAEVSTISHEDGVPAPKTTICPLNPRTGAGWKTDDYEVDTVCSGQTNITDCILRDGTVIVRNGLPLLG